LLLLIKRDFITFISKTILGYFVYLSTIDNNGHVRDSFGQIAKLFTDGLPQVAAFT
jgi:hypothetical protein